MCFVDIKKETLASGIAVSVKALRNCLGGKATMKPATRARLGSYLRGLALSKVEMSKRDAAESKIQALIEALDSSATTRLAAQLSHASELSPESVDSLAPRIVTGLKVRRSPEAPAEQAIANTETTGRAAAVTSSQVWGAMAHQMLPVLETDDQYITLRVTDGGMDYHIIERWPGKISGTAWVTPRKEIRNIVANKLWRISPGFNPAYGEFSVGKSPVWRYSKSLYPEPKQLEQQLCALLARALK